ncbi:MAG: RNA polymerase sigma factor RpoD/SigA [Clostridium sp.]|nr:RNA polymerase sigma factor RpoD/SigA [Clostridium sp.]MCM1444003.1 RNA polymerase sigma factor RpoD/SigA [Candidatus Amulumruptor caecigallinarius]
MMYEEEIDIYDDNEIFEDLFLNEDNNQNYDCFISDATRSYLKQIGKYKKLNDEEEKILMKRLKNGDKKAYDKFVKHNLKLVVNTAKDYRGYNVPFIDIILYGNEGLYEAINRYDISKGCKFSTYAVPCIKTKIIRGIRENLRLIIPSFHISEEINKYLKIYSYLLIKLEHEPTIEEMASELNISIEEALLLEHLSKDDISINQQFEDNDKLELGDLIIDETVNVEEKVTSDIYFAKIINFINDNLNEKEIDIIKKRFGFDNKIPMSYDEIGKIYGVSRERIRVIVNNIFKKLRNSKEFQKISGYNQKSYKK